MHLRRFIDSQRIHIAAVVASSVATRRVVRLRKGTLGAVLATLKQQQSKLAKSSSNNEACGSFSTPLQCCCLHGAGAAARAGDAAQGDHDRGPQPRPRRRAFKFLHSPGRRAFLRHEENAVPSPSTRDESNNRVRRP